MYYITEVLIPEVTTPLVIDIFKWLIMKWRWSIEIDDPIYQNIIGKS